MPIFTKICLVGAESLHADRRTDRHDDANSRFFCKFAYKPNNQNDATLEQ